MSITSPVLFVYLNFPHSCLIDIYIYISSMASAFNVSDEVLSIFVPVLVYWVAAAFYTFLGSYFHNYRLHPVGAEEKENLVPKAQVIRAVLCQQLLQILMQILMIKMVMSEEMTKKKPSLVICSCQFMVAMVVLDLWEYCGHRLMHVNKFMYKHVHSRHHALVVPYAWGAFYSHPFEGLFLAIIGAAVASLISGMTPRTSMFFYSFATIKSIDIHSSLYLPWNPLRFFFRNDSAFHDIHHSFKGSKFNYAPILISWDMAFGTYMPFTVEKRSEGGGFQARPLEVLKDV